MHAPAADSKDEPFHSGKMWSVAALMIPELLAVSAEGIRVKGQQEIVALDKVAAVQTMAAIDAGKMRFESGLELDLQDGRVRQGSAVTTYKAQGAGKMEMIRVEDNRSLTAMANREDLHVAFTRHRVTARMFVQDINVLHKAANRSIIDEVSARDLEKVLGQQAERKLEAVVSRRQSAWRNEEGPNSTERCCGRRATARNDSRAAI
jgi:hypothetical protein